MKRSILLIGLFSSFQLYSLASVQKNLIKSILYYCSSQSIALEVTALESALNYAATQRLSADEGQHFLILHLLEYVKREDITLTASGLGAAIVSGALGVPKEVVIYLLHYAVSNGITISASSIESALQQAALEWTQLSDDQLSVVNLLLQYAREHSVTLTASGLSTALTNAATTLQAGVVKSILHHAERTAILLSASQLESALTEAVTERDTIQTDQQDIVAAILAYAVNQSIDLTADGLGSVIGAAATKYIISDIVD